MNQTFLAAMLGAFLAAPFVALAQPTPGTAGPSDPGAAVTPIVYESVFTRPAQAAEQATPDKLWRAANEEVAASSAHAGHGTHEADAPHAGHAGAMPAAQPAQAPAPRPAVPPAPARQPAPVDHSKHH